MNGAEALRTICASLAAALALCALACLLPDNPYQRWQLADRPLFDTLQWAYERIHFDDRPIDVVVVGPSRTFFGVSMPEVEQRLSERGQPVHVANFSVPGEGRNLHWAVLAEVFKVKSPKVVVVGVSEPRTEFGHPEFKKVAPAAAIAFPPASLLHNYAYDLAFLPARQAQLFFARLFPELAGLRDTFDREAYARTKSDYSTGHFVIEGKAIDMAAEVPADVLDAEPLPRPDDTRISRLLMRCCNDGDDRVYLRAIAELAKAHGARLIFVFMPSYKDTEPSSDRAFLSQYGAVIDNSDLAQNSGLYYNRQHLNHAGAVIVSDRIASVIAELKTSKLDYAP
ncbi:hypothetical protein [Roseiarcus sp.]|uniref:hypothetical protein n=1 Tax=Roseiarcus sp. TaxID=1969460 RepID=UPI003F9A6220